MLGRVRALRRAFPAGPEVDAPETARAQLPDNSRDRRPRIEVLEQPEPGQFSTVYHSNDGLPVRLESAPRVTVSGVQYTHHRLVVSDGRPGAVIVASDEQQRVMLVLSRREAMDEWIWELPRGAGDLDDPAALATGVRELREETGHATRAARVLGVLVTDSAIFPQRVAIVHCLLKRKAPRSVPDGEVAAARWCSPADLEELISSGVIHDALSLSAIALWRNSSTRAPRGIPLHRRLIHYADALPELALATSGTLVIAALVMTTLAHVTGAMIWAYLARASTATAGAAALGSVLFLLGERCRERRRR
ncbi:NUDIX hydrolase [Leucobacter sp. HY1910]